jgi:uncharacterized protein (TIGR02600 family)
MKVTHPHLIQPRGTALLPTLMILGMVAGVVVLFFSLSTIHSRTAASQVASRDLSSLQDTAINMVISQLRQGTTESNALWISQPGALRTYTANSGDPSRVYKLYSARDMVVNASSLTTASAKNLEDDVVPTWDAEPNIYGDLNAPAVDSTNGKLSFPIVDPRLHTAGTSPATPEGFSYTNSLASKSASGQTGEINGIITPTSVESSQRLPMPVRWIYILQDGSMGVLDGSGTSATFVPFQGQSDATAANPIVGRIAYWTDDETTKININTAGEGLFWDTPRCATNQEIAFAKSPPVRNEVHRFGGHPATTSLSTIFFPGERLRPEVGADATKLEQLYAVVPRVNPFGSNQQYAGAMGNNLNPVEFDSDRLYTSVDEFLLEAPEPGNLNAPRTPNLLFNGDTDRLKRVRFLLTAESRAPETTAAGTPRISLWPVSFWNKSATEAANKGKRTSFDNLSAFATTLGNRPYHFRRSGAASNMDDFSNYYSGPENDQMGYGMIHNNHLAQYLVAMMQTRKAGYAKSFTEKYDSIYSNRPHNSGSGAVAMLEYIRQTNAFDSTHSTVLPRKPVQPYAQASTNWIGTDTIGQVAAVDMNYYSPPLNENNKVLKRETSDDGNDRVWTTGLGREFTVSEVGMVFALAAHHPAAPGVDKVNPDLVTALNLQRGQKAIQVGFVAEGFCPAQGYTMIAPSSSFNILQLQHLRITTALGTRGPGGKILTPPLIQENGDGDPNPTPPFNYRERWGTLLHNVSHLQYLTEIKPQETPLAGRNTNGNWWVGWGGSGGYWMYADSDLNGASDAAHVPDLDVAAHSLTSPAMYSRGYFIVPENAATMIVSSLRTGGTTWDRCLEIRVGNQRNGDYSSRRLFLEIPDNMVVPVPSKRMDGGVYYTFSSRYKKARVSDTGDRFQTPELIDGNDVVRTWVVRHGDYRLAYQRLREGGSATSGNVFDPNKRLFVPHPAWDPANLSGTALTNSQLQTQIHAFVKAGGKPHSTGLASSIFAPGRRLIPPTFGDATTQANLVQNVTYNADYRPDFVVPTTSPVFRANVPSSYPYSVIPSETRDWDNGTGIAPDGPYWNKPDDIAKVYDGTIPPYFTPKPWDGININSTPENQTTAPNQLMPSAVMFGSLPSAPSTGLQWTTYLFRPDITPGGHLGSEGHGISGSSPGAPPDHSVLDLFWMPVVQPYAISEPFSTAGKINMNYRIAPFTYIKRATGLHAVMKSEQMLAIPNNAGTSYKSYASAGSNGSTNTGGKNGWRHHIDAEKTLVQWEDKFNTGNFFKHAGEVCEQFLVPVGQAGSATSSSSIRSAMQTFWDNHRLTGDNTLERPYANIYPRLTTRSNTYRVHYLVQTITKARSTPANTFDHEKDSITGELQGDAVVERAIDPSDPKLGTPDFDYIQRAIDGTLASAKSLDELYTWRIRQVRRFTR